MNTLEKKDFLKVGDLRSPCPGGEGRRLQPSLQSGLNPRPDTLLPALVCLYPFKKNEFDWEMKEHSRSEDKGKKEIDVTLGVSVTWVWTVMVTLDTIV